MQKKPLKHTMEQLKELQALPLERKVGITIARITEFYDHFNGKVCISFSGGKDSTVLLYIARKLYPEIKAVYCDTGLEFPEIKDFVRTFDNVDIVRPEKPFHRVIKEEGFPVVSKEVAQYILEYRKWREECLSQGLAIPPRCSLSKFRRTQLLAFGDWETGEPSCSTQRPQEELLPPPQDLEVNGHKAYYYNLFRYNMCRKWAFLVDAPFKISAKCCDIMKKAPLKKYKKENGLHSIIGTMAQESMLRQTSWLKNGCNAFDSRDPKSAPMSFWTDQDVLQYIKKMDIPICKVYGDITTAKDGKLHTSGMERTGCMYCLFGIQKEKQPNRIQRLYYSHPKIYDYILAKLGLKEVMDYMHIPYEPIPDLLLEAERRERLK